MINSEAGLTVCGEASGARRFTERRFSHVSASASTCRNSIISTTQIHKQAEVLKEEEEDVDSILDFYEEENGSNGPVASNTLSDDSNLNLEFDQLELEKQPRLRSYKRRSGVISLGSDNLKEMLGQQNNRRSLNRRNSSFWLDQEPPQKKEPSRGSFIAKFFKPKYM